MAVATTSAQGEAPHALSSVGGGAASSMSMSSSIINDAPEQQYSLRWNDFPASMISNFRHLRDHLDFVDVTLACSKNTNYLAHKVVLSACSPYFRSILKDAAQCTHPVIIMRDVPHTDIEQLLSFMYHGEVAVSQNQLPSFLKTAEMLQIRGLTDSKDDKDEKQDKVDIQPIFNNTVGNTMDNNTTKRNHIDSVDKSPTSKRRRSYTPELTGLTSEPVSRPTSGSGSVSRMGNNAESLLGQALEGGPTILTPSKKKHRRRRSTGGNESDDGANSDADVSLNDSQIKSEPINDTINDTFDRSLFHGAFMNLQQAASYMPGPSGIQDSRMGSLPASMAIGVSNKDSQHQQLHHHRRTSQSSSSTAVENFARLYSALSSATAAAAVGRQQQQQQQQHCSQQASNNVAEELRPVCRYCGRSYSSPSNLRQHVKNVHSNWPPPDTWPQCNVCGKRCKTKHYLINHQLQAHGIHQRPSLAGGGGGGGQQQQQPHPTR
ncbi:protein tramtrack, alpha isoform isoform X3 [Trichogramma pretiosum]|uniref:protein tramtrack, alpha isoform isoform X3 n=1 Tax=Trichogramma pretiosum TaxID=7493 RepID=UPI000C71ABB4|nr:protein tramtrack, alpha isoform isoform X3 [Trichogramma pretiosum]